MTDLRRMRLYATGALAAMAALYVLSKSLEHRALFWGCAAAFAEAAMVGALADWFAVVALFRHPVGLPIPHTAIIPSNQDRIGRTLAHFVVKHFLSGEAVGQRFERMDLTARAAEWLWANAGRVAEQVRSAAPVLLRVLDDEDVRRLLHETILARLRAVEIAPLAGKALQGLTAGQRGDLVLDAAVALAEELVRANQEFIRAYVRQRIPLPDLPGVSFVKDVLGDSIGRRVAEAMLESLREVRLQASHPLRQQFRSKLTDLAEALQHSEEYRLQGEALKEELLRHPAVGGYVAESVRGLKRDLEKDLASPDSRFRAQAEHVVVRIAHLLIEDQALRAKLNAWLRSSLVELVQRQGPDAGRFIQERVRAWDSGQFTRTLEEAVGRDLQYIRLNGTLVGGAVGLAIYIVSGWVW